MHPERPSGRLIRRQALRNLRRETGARPSSSDGITEPPKKCTVRKVGSHAAFLDCDQIIENIQQTCEIGTLYTINDLQYDSAGLASC